MTAVADLLVALSGAGDVDVEALAPHTPAGLVDLPLLRVDLAAGVEAAAAVDASWLAEVDRRRTAAREDVVAAGRGEELEAALHVALLAATGPVGADIAARVASGARLWLLAGAVASALRGEPDHFQAWGRLVAAGWWPIGPCGGHLVVA
jgi:hypothetical protein